MDKILIIDDDRLSQKFLKNCLVGAYEVRTADEGNSGLALAKEWSPHVVLLDVEMPGKNGYEVCDELKHSTITQDIPVIFLSSHNETREHLLGYEVGGDDFLVKPCSTQVLQKKIALMTEYFRQKQNLKNSVSTAEKTAIEALTTSFELGKAVRFVERTYTLNSFESLGAALTEVMSDLGLSACTAFLTQSGQHFFSTQMKVTPLEAEVMLKLHSDSRFFDFGCRTQVNSPQVALLIKNMPLDDRSRYGRIKDILPYMLGAADAKVRVLQAEQALRTENQNLLSSVQTLEKVLAKVRERMQSSESQLRSIMADLTGQLSLQLHHLGLEKDQEDYVLAKVDNASDALHSTLLEAQPVEKSIAKIIQMLSDMAITQEKIITETLISESDDNSKVTNDIELF